MSELNKELLAFMVNDTHSLSKILGEMSPANFESKQCRNMFRMIENVFKKYRSIPTKKILADRFSQNWNESYDELFDDISSRDVNVEELRWTVDRVHEEYNRILVKRMMDEVSEYDFSDKDFDIKQVNLKVREHLTEIDKIYKVSSYKENTLSNSADEFLARYKERKENPLLARGIHLGYKEFDRITNGLREGELLFIGGESGHGKSTLAMNMATNAWMGKNKITDTTFEHPGCHIIFFSVEMSYDMLENRFYSSMAGVPLYGVRDGNLSPSDEEKMRKAAEFIKRYPFHFDIKDVPRGATLRDIELKYLEKCREIPGYEDEKKIIVLDYISLLSLEGARESDWLDLGRLSEGLHELCREYGLPIISPVQLNRPKSGSNSRVANMDRIGRSAMIPQNANIILNIESREEEELRTDMVIRIAKMRDGEKGVFTLQKRLDIMTLIDEDPNWTPASYSDDDDDGLDDGYGKTVDAAFGGV